MSENGKGQTLADAMRQVAFSTWRAKKELASVTDAMEDYVLLWSPPDGAITGGTKDERAAQRQALLVQDGPYLELRTRLRDVEDAIARLEAAEIALKAQWRERDSRVWATLADWVGRHQDNASFYPAEAIRMIMREVTEVAVALAALDGESEPASADVARDLLEVEEPFAESSEGYSEGLEEANEIPW